MNGRELLNERIKTAGIKKGTLCKEIDVTYKTLSKKLAGASDFTESEMQTLSRVLHLSVEDRMAIFFADEVGKMATA